ncbi:MAG TPA: RHS repeat-associated core domain-containing protein, partial [bacterium]|nr:RHS repeat-associated core domain-containing protein [bacterium]
LIRLRDTISNNDATKYFLVDDIRFSPYDSPFSGIAYEKTYGLPVTSVGSNGEFSKTMYDRFQRNIGTIVNDQFVPGTQMMYYSRKGNADTLNNNDLNAAVSVTASGAGKMDDFADGTADGWSLGTGIWTVTSGELTCTGSGANDYATLTGTGSAGVRAKVRSVNGGENYGIQIGNVLFTRYSGAWKITIGSYSQTTSAMPSGTDWLAIVRDSVSLLYVDGKQIFNVRKWNTGGNVSFYVGSFNTVAGFDDFLMFRDPGVALSYLDGSGKVVQSQFLDSVGTVVSATLYDPLNRDAIVTKSAKYDSMFAFRKSFVSGFNWSSGIMTGYITTTGNAGSYPYSRLKFEDSPLSGVIESSAPGDTFRIGRKTVKSAYGSNVTGDGFRDDLPASQYYMETSVDADGDSSWNLTDQSGKVISRRSGSVFGRALLDSTAEVEFPEEIDTEPSLKQFTATVNQTCSYTCYLSGGVGGVPSKSRTAYFKIGTTFGGSDIVSHSKTGNPGQNFSGTFSAQAGVTYYIEVSGYVDVSIASGAVMYKSFGEGMYYPQTSYEYDDAGNLTRVYTPNYFTPPSGTALTDTNFIIRFQYDYTGKLLSRKSPDGGTTRYMYDRLGRLRFSVNANGDAASPDIISYIKYDTYGRKTEEGYYAYNWSGLTQTLADSASWPAPPTWRKKYSFDGDTSKPYMRGRLQKLQTNNDGDSTLEVEESYTYDIFGRMTSKSLNVADFDAALYTSSYAYDFAGNITQMTYPSTGTQIRYSYNASGALVAIGTPSDSDYFAGYRYYPDGALKEERLNNNTIIRSFTYNSAGWLTKIDDNYFRENIDYIANGYGGAGYFDGNIAKTFYKYKWLPDSMTYQYKYDKFGRLLVADNSVSSNWDMGVGQETVFDANGNIVKMKYGALAKTYAYYTGTNKIKNTDGSGNDYVYDNIGNVTKSTPKTIDSLFYDPFINRTKQISKSTSKMTFQYDGTERRVYKKDSTSAISREFLYLYDGLNAVAVKRKGGGTTEYVYGPTGLIASNINGTWYFVLKDHLGSSRVIVDQSGSSKAAIDYAPYGAIIRTSGSPNIAYQFTGQEYDSTSGLWNYKARMYDAELGVFYAMDPAGQFAGAYIGLGNNPVNGTDPTGTVFGIDDVIFLAMVVASMEYADKFSQGKDGRSAFGLGFVKGFAQGVIFGAPDPLTLISSVAVSMFVPDKKVGPVRISPVFAFGSEGYTGGVNVSLEGNIGNFRGSVGTGLAYTGSTGPNSNHTEGLFARGNVTAGVGKHNWVAVGLARYQGISGTDPDFNQSLLQFNTYLSDAGGFAFNWSNDLPFSDKGRTASAEVGFGQNLIGFNVFTSEHGDVDKAFESAQNGSAYVSEVHGVNEAGSYNDRGTPYFSAFYFARRSGRNVFRTGVNAPWVQNVFQNGAHQLIGVPYFIPGNYPARPYGYFGRYNPFIY